MKQYIVLKRFNRISKPNHLTHLKGDVIELSDKTAEECIKIGAVKPLKEDKQAPETRKEAIEKK